VFGVVFVMLGWGWRVWCWVGWLLGGGGGVGVGCWGGVGGGGHHHHPKKPTTNTISALICFSTSDKAYN